MAFGAGSNQRRIVTGHKSGKSAVLSDTEIQPNAGWAANVATIWETQKHPAECYDSVPEFDQKRIYNSGSVIRFVDFPPNSTGHSHRTTTVDYGIVMNGEIEMVLEDGSKSIARAGDIIIQQGTAHQWNNLTDTPTRILFILLTGEPVVVDGQTLEDIGIPQKFKA